jgi:hypothetical protein
VPPQLLGRILDALQQQYGIDASAELSMEADPGTFGAAQLRQYKALGINRLSMGVQSFQQVRCLCVRVCLLVVVGGGDVCVCVCVSVCVSAFVCCC